MNAEHHSPTNRKWLLVDDDPGLLDLLATQLVLRLNRDVITCSRPLEALELVRKNPERFEYVITDRHMPEMHGDELLAELVELNPALRALVVTGDDTGLAAALDRHTLAAAILLKPYRIEQLLHAIERAPGLGDRRELVEMWDSSPRYYAHEVKTFCA